MLQIIEMSKVFNAGTVDENVLFDKFSLTVNDGEFVAVVGSNGSLTGYAGGIERKIELLTLEKACMDSLFVPAKGAAL